MTSLRDIVIQDLDVVEYIINNPLHELSNDDKVYIQKELTRPRPPLPDLPLNSNLANNRNRSFSMAFYDRCDWLTGSTALNKLFCWDCLLFAQKRAEPWSDGGYNNLKDIYKSIEKHGATKVHTFAAIKLKLFRNQNISDNNEAFQTNHQLTIEKYNSLVKENRAILKRLIDMVLYLGCQEMALREQDGTNNFKELAQLLSSYDTAFKLFLNESSDFKDFAETIQNDLIDSINFVVEEYILSELKNAICFSWQIDESTDISCTSQLSIIVRYCYDNNVYERFLGFYDVSKGRTAEDLFEFFTNKFEGFDLENKLVGQTYDGTAVMSAELNALQAKIQNIAPQAIFTHCFAYKLNLLLQDAAGSIKECRIFFANLNGFSTFFTKSTKRTNLLDDLCKKRFPGSAETRWNFKSRITERVLKTRIELKDVFNTITNSNDFKNDHASIREAMGLQKCLIDFTFLFLLQTFNLIFQQTDIIFSIIRDRPVDILYSSKRIEVFLQKIKSYRSEEKILNDIFDTVVEQLGPPTKRRKHDLDELGNKIYFKRLFGEILDVIIIQLEIRFKNFKDLIYLDLLNTSEFEVYNKKFPQNLVDMLLENYPKFFDKTKLQTQLAVLYMDKDLFIDTTDYLNMLRFIKRHTLEKTVPEVFKLINLILTLPSTTASVEHSVSALKRIRNYTRNPMSQNTLKKLSIISVEKSLIRHLIEESNFYEDVIDHFASGKNRSIDLIYKIIYI